MAVTAVVMDPMLPYSTLLVADQGSYREERSVENPVALVVIR